VEYLELAGELGRYSRVNLSQVVGRRFFFVGLLLELEGCEASPIRAIAIPDQV
jgi:kynurenine formamidase